MFGYTTVQLSLYPDNILVCILVFCNHDKAAVNICVQVLLWAKIFQLLSVNTKGMWLLYHMAAVRKKKHQIIFPTGSTFLFHSKESVSLAPHSCWHSVSIHGSGFWLPFSCVIIISYILILFPGDIWCGACFHQLNGLPYIIFGKLSIQIFCVFWIIALYQVCLLQICTSSHGLSFHSLGIIFHRAETFNVQFN